MYPILCNSNDPVAAVFGAMDSMPDDFTFERATSQFQELIPVTGLDGDADGSNAADVVLCTSPFFLCAMINAVLLQVDRGREGRTLLFNYLGLPALWKAPVDLRTNPPAEEAFWRIGRDLFRRESSVVVTNNPLLFHQLQYAFGLPVTAGRVALEKKTLEQSKLRVLRPHNRYMNAYYVPRSARLAGSNEDSAMTTKGTKSLHNFALVSRTKFQWVTMQCLLRRMISKDKLPLEFEVLNTDSKKTFSELAAFSAVVLVPWEAALMAFYEFYSMGRGCVWEFSSRRQ